MTTQDKEGATISIAKRSQEQAQNLAALGLMRIPSLAKEWGFSHTYEIPIYAFKEGHILVSLPHSLASLKNVTLDPWTIDINQCKKKPTLILRHLSIRTSMSHHPMPKLHFDYD